MRGEFAGRVVVVTGGSGGIGRAIAGGFAAAGADVVIASRKIENCRAVAEELDGAYGTRCLPVGYHAGHWDDSDRLADQVLAHYGPCDVLVNNPGKLPPHSRVPSVTEGYFDK